ncbi:hypothetical protein BJ170DRAFT_734892 [Xylariales sp. AK1849]|nr:hypothetical protein BJ170DRAFT_734892 [Xylariales sp. AK1849]
MSESWCAHKIANLEGQKHLKYLDLPGTNGSLEGLDIRIRRLETTFQLPTLAPMLTPTWESLEYRIRQVQTRQRVTNVLKIPDTKAAAAVPKTLGDVKHMFKLLFVLANEWLTVDPLPGHLFDVDAATDEDTQLREIAQRLCYLAGRTSRDVTDFDNEVASVYELAVQLSLLTWSRTTHVSPLHGRPAAIVTGLRGPRWGRYGESSLSNLSGSHSGLAG